MTEVSTRTPAAASAESLISMRELLPPVRCATWCADGTGHADALFFEDQYCSSLVLDMPATLHDADEHEVDLGVYARKEAGEDAPYLVIRTPDDREVRLTRAEGLRLADLLTHMAWVAEQDGREKNAYEIGRDFERGQQ